MAKLKNKDLIKMVTLMYIMHPEKKKKVSYILLVIACIS